MELTTAYNQYSTVLYMDMDIQSKVTTADFLLRSAFLVFGPVWNYIHTVLYCTVYIRAAKRS